LLGDVDHPVLATERSASLRVSISALHMRHRDPPHDLGQLSV